MTGLINNATITKRDLVELVSTYNRPDIQEKETLKLGLIWGVSMSAFLFLSQAFYQASVEYLNIKHYTADESIKLKVTMIVLGLILGVTAAYFDNYKIGDDNVQIRKDQKNILKKYDNSEFISRHDLEKIINFSRFEPLTNAICEKANALI